MFSSCLLNAGLVLHILLARWNKILSMLFLCAMASDYENVLLSSMCWFLKMFVWLLWIWMSRKSTLSFGKLSVVKFNIFFCTKSKVSSTYRMHAFIQELSTKSLTIIFSNSVMIIFARTGPKGDLIDTPHISL